MAMAVAITVVVAVAVAVSSAVIFTSRPNMCSSNSRM